MAEEVKEESLSLESPKHSFVEVFCKISSKFRRFAVGTTAGFALYAINTKLCNELPRPLYIEAIKDGEEPVTFGPSAVLVNYGEGWKLQTVVMGDIIMQTYETSDHLTNPSNFRSFMKSSSEGSSTISRQYILKILIAFIFIFFLGGLFTVLLEYLPQFILFAASYF